MPPEQPYERLGWKTYWIFVSEQAKLAITIGVGCLGAILFLGPGAVTGVLSLIFLLALGLTLLISWIEYKNFGFRFDAEVFKIRRGVLHRDELAIPYRHIEDIDLERNILNQLTGTAELVLLTAGHEDEGQPVAEAEGIIPVVDYQLARRLQQELSTRANIQKVVAVNPASGQ